MRTYRGPMVDSSRWERFRLRAGDVVITTPSKCGTTWMQHIVGMLLLDTVDLGVPLSRISPWLDMLLRPEREVFDLLEAQTHRRFLKTHTPLDGIPVLPEVTYLAVVRHPLDVVLSDLDHDRNFDGARMGELRAGLIEGAGFARPDGWRPAPEGDDPRERLLWFLDNDNPPCGSGPYGLADFCQQVETYWRHRSLPNVHLFHYQDLWDDLPGEMRRVSAALEVPIGQPGRGIDGTRFVELVDAATLDRMRSRAEHTAPEADRGVWRDAAAFFSQGGRRAWADLLTGAETDRFHRRLRELAGPATEWILRGRVALIP